MDDNFDDVFEFEHEDLDYYLENEPEFQQEALEGDPLALELNEDGGHRNIYQPHEGNMEIKDLVVRHADKALPPDNIRIPPLPQKDRRKLNRILEGKKRHLDQVDAEARHEPGYILVNKFSEPVNAYLSLK